MPFASIVVPAFNVQSTISETLDALLDQTFSDYEIIIVNDGSTDATAEVIAPFASHPKIKIITQRNRGLAGARNTGIAAAKGAVIGFCDSDDLWEPTKLQAHVSHFKNNPEVGVSYSGSALINDNGDSLGSAQRPRLNNVSISHILKRNPIGNGSAVVIRREVLQEIAYRPECEAHRDWFFDETFRQSEDIECWMRIALTTNWKFEGVEGLLTKYRINSGGLSAATQRQLDAWDRMVSKLSPLNPAFFDLHLGAARAYQLRYLARRAISDLDANRAGEMMVASLRHSLRPLFEEPAKTVTTLGALCVLRFAGPAALNVLMQPKGN